MAECVECGDDFRLEDGYEDDGMCHQCAHAIAEAQNSRMVSERDLTIRDLRAREEQGARIRQQIEDTLRAADTRATQAEARAERYREALETLYAGTRDPDAHGLGETLPVEYTMPPSTNRKVRALIREAIAATGDEEGKGGEGE